MSKKKRFEVFKRDKFTCQYCGQQPPEVILEVDHIQAVANNGGDDYSNLITACFSCNRGKGDRSGSESECDNVQAMQLETVAQQAAFNKMLRESIEDNDGHISWLCSRVADRLGMKGMSSRDVSTIRNFSKKLTPESMLDAAEITSSKGLTYSSGWRYFCKVCWNKINEKTPSTVDHDEEDEEEDEYEQCSACEDNEIKCAQWELWQNERDAENKEKAIEIAAAIKDAIKKCEELKDVKGTLWQLSTAFCLLAVDAKLMGYAETDRHNVAVKSVEGYRDLLASHAFRAIAEHEEHLHWIGERKLQSDELDSSQEPQS